MFSFVVESSATSFAFVCRVLHARTENECQFDFALVQMSEVVGEGGA